MSTNSAFYKTLFQYDTLFRVEEDLSMLKFPSVPAEPEKDSTPAPRVDTQQADTAVAAAPAVHTPKEETPQVVVPQVVAPVEKKEPVAAPPRPVAPPPPVVPAVPFPALKHKVLVLVDEPTQPDLLPSEYILLSNILKAVGHSIDEADIVNLSYVPATDARSVFADKLTNHFITFGVPLIKLQLDLLLPPYTPKQVEGIWFLLADPLAVIEADRNLKKQLWLALQKIFAVG